jgi:hypothetical protein
MMKKTLYLIAITVLTLTACKNDPTPKEVALQAQIESYDLLKSEAMKVHDEIMPKMGELMELNGALIANEKAKELSEIGVAAENLKDAHDAMMSWMQDYSEKFPYGESTPDTKEALDEKLPILEQEVKEIVQLKGRTMIAIENAQELLKE